MIKKFFTSTATYIMAVFLLLTVLIGVWNIRPDGFRREGSGHFCGARAFVHVYNLSQVPRSPYDFEALEDARVYIMTQLDRMGLIQAGSDNFEADKRIELEDLSALNRPNAPHFYMVRHTPLTGTIPERVVSRDGEVIRPDLVSLFESGEIVEIPVDNIYAYIPGTSGYSIMLMAHYDSHPNSLSTGLADNAYSVATMLEIARLLMEKINDGYTLVNGVKFVFTDAEEIGLWGAHRIVGRNGNPYDEEHPAEYLEFMKGVNLVVNIEGRGNRGPLFMFETSEGNSAIIRFFSNAGRPFSFSIATAVYGILPMNTDLTPFLRAGFASMNFSTLDSMEHYHTDYDSLNYINMDTLQNYGNTLFPMVIHYVMSSRYSSIDAFEARHDAVFFSFMPNIFIRYHVIVSWILIVLLLAGFGTLIFIMIKNKKLDYKKMLIAMGVWAGFIVIAAGVGILIAVITGAASGVSFSLMSMTFVSGDRLMTIVANLLVVSGAFGAMILLKKLLKISRVETRMGGICLNVLLLIISAFLLHGGTFMFMWTALFGLGAVSATLISKAKLNLALKISANALVILFAVPMFFTIAYSFFVAMTIGALVVITLLVAAAFAIVAPSVVSLWHLLNENLVRQIKN
ncbi:MAG: M28 family peptidase [Firmicutes bacterium]|nr:M28 family peptidase [Bacillota bacterium]